MSFVDNEQGRRNRLQDAAIRSSVNSQNLEHQNHNLLLKPNNSIENINSVECFNCSYFCKKFLTGISNQRFIRIKREICGCWFIFHIVGWIFICLPFHIDNRLIDNLSKFVKIFVIVVAGKLFFRCHFFKQKFQEK